MTTLNPLNAEQMIVAAEVCDAVDPALTIDQRIDACERAARRDAVTALVVATQLLHGAVAAAPNPSGMMAALRARIALEEAP